MGCVALELCAVAAGEAELFVALRSCPWDHNAARIILAEVEKDISSMLGEAANVYDENEHALQLRAMHAVNDGMRDSGSMVVVPSSLGDSFGNAADFLKRL